jgi:hypothetical protein
MCHMSCIEARELSVRARFLYAQEDNANAFPDMVCVEKSAGTNQSHKCIMGALEIQSE